MEKLAIINIYIGLMVFINLNGKKALRGYLLSYIGISSLISLTKVQGNETDFIVLNLLFIFPALILILAKRIREKHKR